MTISPATPPHRFPGRSFLALGLCLPVLGLIAYVVQISLHRLMTPWYLPVLATVGVILILFSLWERRSVWRWLALLLVLLFAGAGWAFLVAMRSPPYTGPIAVGQPFPAFTATLANGNSFTQRDLEGKQNNVLVFFRGRW